MADWSLDRRRLEWPALSEWAYLDHALRGPAPRRALDRSRTALELAGRGSLSRAEQSALVEEARAAVATQVGGWCSASCVAFTTNTTSALGLVAQSIPWSAGDRVITQADEVAANRFPWEALAARGVVVDVLPSREGRLELEDLEEALRRPARVVSLAAVSLWSGQRRNLRTIGELASGAGAMFVVDAAQALGSLRLDLSGVDALCGSGRKWLLGPPETGILVLRPGVAETLVCPAPGALSLEADGSWRAGARRYEGGAVGAPILAGLSASCELLSELGAGWIEDRVLGLAGEIAGQGESSGWRVVSPRGTECSGIVILERPGLPPDLEDRLREARIAARVRGDVLRVSAHFWNTAEDVERLFEGLAAL